MRAEVAETLAGPGVHLAHDGVDVFGSVHGQVCALGCLCVCQAAGREVVELRLAGPGSDFSEGWWSGLSQPRWISEPPPSVLPGSPPDAVRR